jgi:hypothetical protein
LMSVSMNLERDGLVRRPLGWLQGIWALTHF